MLLKRETHVQLVYKHAISTIMPGGPLNLKDDEDDDAEPSDQSAVEE